MNHPNDEDRCIACDVPLKDGDAYYPDADGGSVHAACIGPERECYTRNGEPLKDGDCIPEPYIWRRLFPTDGAPVGSTKVRTLP